jgi:hypothetical protein
VSEVIAAAREDRLHPYVRRAETRNVKRRANIEYRARMLYLEAKRNGPPPMAPEQCPECSAAGFDVGRVCAACGYVEDGPPS